MTAGGRAVVIPAYQASATLSQVLTALQPQLREPDTVVVVDSTGDGSAEEVVARHPGVRVIALGERTLPGEARNIGVRSTTQDVLCFIDADAVPAEGWLDALSGALTPGVDAVAGAILNGTPKSAVGSASYLLEFSEWLPGRSGAPAHGATCNLAVHRAALDAAGGFATEFWPGEDTVLTFGFAAAGRLGFCAPAQVRHLNRTGLAEFLRHQQRLGAAFAAVCDHTNFPHRRFARWPYLPLCVPLRLAALTLRVARSPIDALRTLVLLPLLVAGLVAWAHGLAGAVR